MLLKDKFAVISGAATENGIGYATARVFAEHGAIVPLLDLERNAPQKKAATLGDQHRGSRPL
jgi:NAD(P)-dependent dehydrogenase (short-subunit alcohol dehydrogenase family)